MELLLPVTVVPDVVVCRTAAEVERVLLCGLILSTQNLAIYYILVAWLCKRLELGRIHDAISVLLFSLSDSVDCGYIS